MIKTDNKIALVLGSGGARGLAHIGAIKVLEKNKIPIDIIIGTSIGALIGGLYASGISPQKMENIISQINKMMIAKLFMPKLFASGFIDNNNVKEFIDGLIGDIKIEDLEIPFISVATDLITGEEVIFKKGSLVDAIMASIAIPTIFQPVFINNRYLLDGGLSNPLPISIAKEMGAIKTIAVNVSPNPKLITNKRKSKKTEEITTLVKKLPSLLSNLLNEDKENLPISDFENSLEEDVIIQFDSPTILSVFLQSISISTNNLMIQHLRFAKPDILISPNIGDFDMLEFYKGEAIIKCGYNATLKALHEIKSCIKN